MKKIILFILSFFIFVSQAFSASLELITTKNDVNIWEDFTISIIYSWEKNFDFSWVLPWSENFNSTWNSRSNTFVRNWDIWLFQSRYNLFFSWKEQGKFTIWPVKYTLENWEEILSEKLVINVSDNEFFKSNKDKNVKSFTIDFNDIKKENNFDEDSQDNSINKDKIESFKNMLWWFFALITLFWVVWPILLLLSNYNQPEKALEDLPQDTEKAEKSLNNWENKDSFDEFKLVLPDSTDDNFLHNSSVFIKKYVSNLIWENLENIGENSVLILVRKIDKIDNNLAILIIEILEKIIAFKYSWKSQSEEDLKSLENIIYDLYNLKK